MMQPRDLLDITEAEAQGIVMRSLERKRWATAIGELKQDLPFSVRFRTCYLWSRHDLRDPITKNNSRVLA